MVAALVNDFLIKEINKVMDSPAYHEVTIEILREKAKDMGYTHTSSWRKPKLYNVVYRGLSPSEATNSVEKSVGELREEARMKGVGGFSKMTRSQLLNVLEGKEGDIVDPSKSSVSELRSFLRKYNRSGIYKLRKEELVRVAKELLTNL